jgi:pimeloyl-ACP methyl ester carboxylesterase
MGGQPLTLPRRLLALSIVLAGCTTTFHAVPPSGDEVTIFIPGYKGSFLNTDSDPQRHAWINPTDALVSGRTTLALPFEGEKAVPAFGALHADGPLTRLALIPGIIDVDAYESWMEYGTRELPGFIPFGYDWRQDIRATAGQLAALIDHLAAERPGRLRVNLVGHSMGGLIAYYYLRYGSDRTGRTLTWQGARTVSRVAFVGTPFGGAPLALRDLLRGTTTALNSALLSREALFTFASVFELLPMTDGFFVDKGGQPVRFPATVAATWYDEGWGVFSDPELRQNPAYRAQLERMLKAHVELARALGDDATPPPGNLQALVVVGHGRPTISGLRVVDGHVRTDDLPVEDGDDAVVTTRATPPASFPYQRVETGAEHTVLLNDPAVRAAVVAFMRR